MQVGVLSAGCSADADADADKGIAMSHGAWECLIRALQQ